MENSQKGIRRNEEFADVLDRLSVLMQKKGDNIRSGVYRRAHDTVGMIDTDLTSVDDLKGVPNIGPTILAKLKEYTETNDLELFKRERENPMIMFTNIHGIGPKKAEELVRKGITTIDGLRERQDEVLNSVQKIGLKYYEDIMERMPRAEIDEYDKLFHRAFMHAKKTDGAGAQYEIVGSYRRGASTSGDIDVIITGSSADIFTQMVDELIASGVVIEVLSRGSTKCMVIAKLSASATARRVDFMYTPVEEYPFAILYFTGSKYFNVAMRGYALKYGITLNEHGMYMKPKGGDKGDRLAGTYTNEKDIFDTLLLKYVKPIGRTDGRAVEPLSSVIKENVIMLNKQFCDKPVAIPSTPMVVEVKSPKSPQSQSKKRKTVKKPIELKAAEVKKSPKGQTKKRKTVKKPIELKVVEVKKLPMAAEPTPMVHEMKLPIAAEPTPTVAELVPILHQASPKKAHGKTRKAVSKKNVSEKKNINKPSETIIMTSDNVDRLTSILKRFPQEGIQSIESLPERDLENLLKIANDAYYNTNVSLITDAEYDIIRDYMERTFPKNAVLQQVGAPVAKNKVELPYNMPSMDKIKPDTNALYTWTSKYRGPYTMSCKLDGVSGMYSTEGGTRKLYTRGNGSVGQDISHLLSVLKLPTEPGMVVRGEFIIPKQVFAEKYKATFANARNLVSGIINSKKVDEKAADLHFVAYEIIRPEMKSSAQMSKLAELKHEVVHNISRDKLTNEDLSQLLLDWRANYEYEIDGIIVADDHIYARTTSNPDHAFAFKMVISDQIAEAKVVDVIWTPSKSGYLKPRVRIEPIQLSGVTIEYATGFNGKFIEDNHIGVGAIVQIIRSGDVIPHIKSVSLPAEYTKMPSVPYHWTDTHIDIVLDNGDEDETVLEKNITAFFTGIEVDGLSSGNVRRIMNAGYKSVPVIIKMTKDDMAKVEGFKQKMVDKIYTSIHEKLEQATLIDLMSASNLFGRGIGKLKITPIITTFPNILTSGETDEEKVAMLKTIHGIGAENAKSFVSNITRFMSFMQDADLMHKITTKPQAKVAADAVAMDVSHPLYGKHVVMTKIRDAEISQYLERVGGVLDDNIGKKTNILITKTMEDVSTKTKYALEHNIPIMTPETFRAKYMI